MGRGDQRSRRGKIFAGSFGKTRPKNKKRLGIAATAEDKPKKAAPAAEKPKKAAVKKIEKADTAPPPEVIKNVETPAEAPAEAPAKETPAVEAPAEETQAPSADAPAEETQAPSAEAPAEETPVQAEEAAPAEEVAEADPQADPASIEGEAKAE